jgi:hypothetical protein
VRWFSEKAKQDLSALIGLLNKARLGNEERNLLAAILSATTREVSYCRKDQWKLHRMTKRSRSCHRVSVWEVFRRRLKTTIEELETGEDFGASIRVVTGDTRNLHTVLRTKNNAQRFDVVITSPPYGDSKTTVQYGGISAICLGVVQHLRGLGIKSARGAEIDRNCLGGNSCIGIRKGGSERSLLDLHRVWCGGRDNPVRGKVIDFLLDLESCCAEICKCLRMGGVAVFVVGRRSTGGWRVKMDRFLISSLEAKGMCLVSAATRRIEKKMTPLVVSRRGRSGKGEGWNRDKVITMATEFVLVFRKGPGELLDEMSA